MIWPSGSHISLSNGIIFMETYLEVEKDAVSTKFLSVTSGKISHQGNISDKL